MVVFCLHVCNDSIAFYHMQIVRWFLQSREYFGFMLKVSKSCKDVKKGKQFCINELFPLYFIGAYQNNRKLGHIVLKPISASFDGILQVRHNTES